MRLVTATLVLGLACVGTGRVRAGEYHVDTTRARQVKFVSETPLQNFTGVTSRIDGYAVIPPYDSARGQDADSGQFYFEVDLNAMDTGIGLRNSHMRENYLETDKYPYAQYAGAFPGPIRESDTAFSLPVSGRMTIHGVTRPLVSTVAGDHEGQSYHVRGHFPVALTDYRIKIPRLMFMKISDTVQVQVDFFLAPVGSSRETQ